jgi:hypothetical protein
MRHQGGVEANHLAGVTRHDDRSDDGPCAPLHVHFRSTFCFAVQDGTVHLMERLHKGGDGEAGSLGLSSGESDMGDLGIRIRAPGDG